MAHDPVGPARYTNCAMYALVSLAAVAVCALVAAKGAVGAAGGATAGPEAAPPASGPAPRPEPPVRYDDARLAALRACADGHITHDEHLARMRGLVRVYYGASR